MIIDEHITSMDTLIQRLNELPNNFVYRGHADSDWNLASTLERVLGKNWSAYNARLFEERSLSTFISKYHIYNKSEHTPVSKLSWLSVMQHYGTPTRLIDFSESPYIALYFALENYNPSSNKDLSIFALDYVAIMDRSISYIQSVDAKFSETNTSISSKPDQVFEEVVDRFAYDILWITEPLELNARIDRQSGTFLISGNREKTIDSIINSELYSDCKMHKITIDKSLYVACYAALRKMSINSKSIYGDLSGLARAIRMELQVYTS